MLLHAPDSPFRNKALIFTATNRAGCGGLRLYRWLVSPHGIAFGRKKLPHPVSHPRPQGQLISDGWSDQGRRRKAQCSFLCSAQLPGSCGLSSPLCHQHWISTLSPAQTRDFHPVWKILSHCFLDYFLLLSTLSPLQNPLYLIGLWPSCIWISFFSFTF